MELFINYPDLSEYSKSILYFFFVFPLLKRGLAINMIEPLFDCPSIGDILHEDTVGGIQKGFLQNLPSVLCGHALNLQSHHLVLGISLSSGLRIL